MILPCKKKPNTSGIFFSPKIVNILLLNVGVAAFLQAEKHFDWSPVGEKQVLCCS